MEKKDITRKIEQYKRRNLILEAFILQAAYIESLINLYIEIKFHLSIKDADPRVIDTIWQGIEDYSLANLIQFAFGNGWLSGKMRQKLDSYRLKRNDVLHDLIRKLARKDFARELETTYSHGEQIMQSSEFNAIDKFFDLIQRQNAGNEDQDSSRYLKPVSWANKKITAKENNVLVLRLEGETYEEIGNTIGVTRERVRQLLNSGISKIEGTFYKIRTSYSEKRLKGIDLSGEEKIQNIISIVCKTYNIGREDLLSAKRTAKFVLPRHIAIYFLRKNFKLSFPQIAKIMNKLDHTTIIHAYRKISALVETNRLTLSQVEEKNLIVK